MLRKHTREELGKILEFTEDNFERTVTAFLHENLRGLRRAMGSVKFEKQLIKQMKRTGTLAMCRRGQQYGARKRTLLLPGQ